MRRQQQLIAAAIGSSVVAFGGFAYGASASAEDASSAPIEELVVTAQKRVETLQEIPMSVTVLPGDMLERQRAHDFRDLVSLVPGFSINTNSRGISRITLRGINTGGVATTVGMYVNDVPFGSSSGLANAAILSGDFHTFDLQRIEVLRGPQGTLYGASSLGGVMKYVTNEPDSSAFGARAQVSMESVKSGDLGYSANAMVNVPVSDRFAIRASGFYRFEDGFIDSIGDNPIPSLTDPTINVVGGTRVEEDINSVDTFGGRVSALFEPTERLAVNLTAFLQNIETDSSDVVDADPLTLEPLSNGSVRSRYHKDFVDVEYRVYSAAVDWEFRGVSVRSITSYSEFEQDFRLDVAANTALTGLPMAGVATLFFGDPATRPLSAVQDQITSTDKFTQELRLLSEENDTFEWLLGFYYTDEDSGIDPQQILAVEAGTDTLATDIPILLEAALVSDYEEIAFFANATWHITPRLELSFGGRTSENDQRASQVLQGALLPAPVVFDDASSSESPFTYSLSPRFEINDHTSVYARVATGFRPGGPNVIPAGAPPGTPGSYDSDELTSYEVGLKTAGLPGGTMLDVTAFYLDWEDVQLLAVVNGVGLNANGGTAVSRGFEFMVSTQPIDGLTLALNGAYTDAYLTEDTDPVVGGLDGDPLSYVPEWSFGLDANYEWPVMGGSMAYIGGNLGYTDDRPADFSSRAPDGSIREVESYTTVNLRAGIDAGRWSVQIYGRNLADEEGVNDLVGEGVLPNGAVGLGLSAPRTFGIAFGTRF